jgi:hypothetical protein
MDSLRGSNPTSVISYDLLGVDKCEHFAKSF